ncbi:hypothetical protein ACHAXT_010639 [Thalassiosira profunda]
MPAPDDAGAGASPSPAPTAAAAIDASEAETKRKQKLDDLRRRQKREKLLQRAIPILLTLPWLLGLAWTALHPLVSVITGELKCRGQYIDENGLDVHRHRVAVYPLQRAAANNNEGGRGGGVCDAIASGRVPISPAVECLHHAATETMGFDVARILPSMGPVVESTEAVVIVVGSNTSSNRGDWYEESDLHASILHLIQRLGNRVDTPWLSKAVYVVSPASDGSASGNATQLGSTVDAFMSAYAGDSGARPLPPHFTFPIVRSALVLSDVDEFTAASGATEVRILPHGERGSLPNLDLIFATFLSFQSRPAGERHEKTMYYSGSEFRVHPFGRGLEERIGRMVGRVSSVLGLEGPRVEQYAKDLAGLFGFVGGLVVGPRQPHASALSHGIDALTIEVRIPSDRSASSSSSIHPHYADLVRVSEHLLRAISNLHERLHHSIAQYTMPAPSKFVSHGEYIYPAILVTLPMVVRAASLALRDLRRFQFVHVGVVVGPVLVATSCICLLAMVANGLREAGEGILHWIASLVFAAAYVLVVLAARQSIVVAKEKDECRGSLRFVACLLGIYLHAPLLLANYSLGFPSSVFWTPLLATLVLPPSLRARVTGNAFLTTALMAVKVIFLVATSPPMLLVPRIFPWYTPYVLGVYTPLHLLLAAMWLAD